MSTVITHHRLGHQIALAAAATVVVVGGATALGVVLSDDSPSTPTAPAASPQVAPDQGTSDPGRIGMGDFRSNAGSSHRDSFPKGGHTVTGP